MVRAIVMFFGLTNSLATFQVMMNELLRNLINTGKVAAFIDDVIVETETEEGHDELVTEVIRRFLKLVNYYCQFIEGFVSIARPLYDIVKKDKKWYWTEKQKKVFRELKEQFTKELVLAVPDLDKKLRVEVNASDYVIGDMLSMKVENGK